MRTLLLPRLRRRMVMPIALVFALAFAAARGQSDSAQTPAAPPGPGTTSPTPSPSQAWAPPPFVPSTNSVSRSFLDSHPDSDQAAPNVESPAAPAVVTPRLAPPVAAPAPAPTSDEPEQDSTGLETGRAHFAFPEGSPDELSEHLLVVYNSNDPDSQSLADYYAMRRQIADDHVLGIACPTTEEITRKQYEENVSEPILSYILNKDWMARHLITVRVNGESRDLLVATRNAIWAIVLMRGVPLRIAADPTLADKMENFGPLATNAAAVDSELALLPIHGLPAGGFVPNAFFDQANSGLVRAGPELATKIVLVTRLDGPRVADVRRMIDDALYAEQNRLAGLGVIDTRGLADGTSSYAIGDDWLRKSGEMLQKDGWTIKYDTKPEVLPPSDPLNHVGIYLGWYHEGACGPWVTGPDRFARGAIAYHLHSFSATSVRDVNQGWVAPLIAHGAAATMGCVYEPFLDLTPHLDIFTRRLLRGNSFAEAAYASQRGLSWMVTVVGDPLYRPFGKSVDAALAGDNEIRSDHYGWLLLQQVKRSLLRQEIPEQVSSIQHYLDIPGGVVQEGLGDILARMGDAAAETASVQAYREAANLDDQPIDRIRIGLKVAEEFDRQSDQHDAQAEFSTLRDKYPTESAAYGVPGTPGSAPAGPSQLANHPTADSMPAPPKPPCPPVPTPASPISQNP